MSMASQSIVLLFWQGTILLKLYIKINFHTSYLTLLNTENTPLFTIM